MTNAAGDGGVYIGNDGEAGYNGFRFPNVVIPQGTTIDSAKIKFRAQSTRSGTGVNVWIKAWPGDSMRTFFNMAYNQFDSLSKGKDSVVWTGFAPWTVGNDYETPNIANAVQPIINRSGFKSGNAIGLFVFDNGSTPNTGFRYANSWDADPSTAALLEIWYGGGTPPPAPKLVSPANAATGQSLSPILVWNASPGATSYRVQVSTALGFTPTITDTAGVTDTTLILKGLSYGTTYYWHVAATGALGTSLFSGASSFTTQSSVAGNLNPLNISANGRFLQAGGVPVLINGDAAWSIVTQLTYAQADTYLSDRASRGVNMILVNLIEHKYSDHAPNNIYNVAPFTGATFATPNEPYFALADSIINRANQLGIYVLLDPIYLGADPTQGWQTEASNASVATLKAWGTYLGNRYRNYPNIVWVIGGDMDVTGISGLRDKIDSMVAGMKAADNVYAGRLYTTHSERGTQAITHWPESWVTLNDIYTSSSTTTTLAQAAYAHAPVMPYFLIEADYENEGPTTQQVRAEAYWTILLGGCGQVFGNAPIWYFSSTAGAALGPWQSYLASPGSLSMQYLNMLLTSRNWSTLTPDTNGSVLTAGASTGTDLGAVAYTSDSSSIIGYFPSQRAVTINPAPLKGDSIKVTWYDPSAGVSTVVGSFTKTSRSYTPPSASDWVLVIDGNMKSNGALPPSAPTLVSPANGATGISTGPTLTWNASTNATSYHLQVATDSAFSKLVVDQSNITATSSGISGLTSGTKYYWHVNASNTGGTSSYSVTYNFTTQIAAPSAPTLASPASGATGVSTSPTLTWNASAGATSYRLQVSTDTGFSKIVVDQSNLASTSLALSGLANGTTYYWHVNASNTGGTSAYSTTSNFTTQIAAPLAPTLASPANGSTGVSINPTLSWNTSATATSYRLQVATDTGFSKVVVDQSNLAATSFAVSGLMNNTTYYWHVNASNAGGTSLYSATSNFTTQIAAPQAPTLASPASGSTGLAISMTLTWNASATATSYRLQLSTDPAFGTVFLDQSNITGTSLAVTAMSYGTTYYWRVNASNAGGTGSYSAIWNFTTVPATGVLLTFQTLGTSSGTRLVTHGNTLMSYSVCDSAGYLDSLIVSMHNNWDGNDTVYGIVYTGTASKIGALVGRSKDSVIVNTANLTPYVFHFTPGTISMSKGTIYYIGIHAMTANGYTRVGTTNNTSGRIGYDLDTPPPDNPWVKSEYVGLPQLAAVAYYHTVVLGAVAGLPVPLLRAPAYTTASLSTSVTLSWNASSGATSYHVQVASDSTFSQPEIDQAGLEMTSLPIEHLAPGTSYYWHVRAINSESSSAFSSAGRFTTNLRPGAPSRDSAAASDPGANNSIPRDFALRQNYPNPFNPTTRIELALPQSCQVTLEIFNVLGQKVKTLLDGQMAAGSHIVEWNSTDDRGRHVSSGLYLYRLTAGSYIETRKMVLLK